MSKKSRNHSAKSWDEAIRAVIWLSIDLIDIALTVCDDDDIRDPLLHLRGCQLDALVAVRAIDMSDVPF